MGAEAHYKVKVEKVTHEWIDVYAVTSDEAMWNANGQGYRTLEVKHIKQFEHDGECD